MPSSGNWQNTTMKDLNVQQCANHINSKTRPRVTQNNKEETSCNIHCCKMHCTLVSTLTVYLCNPMWLYIWHIHPLHIKTTKRWEVDNFSIQPFKGLFFKPRFYYTSRLERWEAVPCFDISLAPIKVLSIQRGNQVTCMKIGLVPDFI